MAGVKSSLMGFLRHAVLSCVIFYNAMTIRTKDESVSMVIRFTEPHTMSKYGYCDLVTTGTFNMSNKVHQVSRPTLLITLRPCVNSI